MNIKEAKQALLEGKKVSNKDWSMNEYVYLELESNFVFDEFDYDSCNIDDFEEYFSHIDSEWIIYKDKKYLTEEFNKVLEKRPKKNCKACEYYVDKLEDFIKENLIK